MPNLLLSNFLKVFVVAVIYCEIHELNKLEQTQEV